MAKSDERRVHPYIPRLVEQLEARRVDRREFLRTATLLGMSSARRLRHRRQDSRRASGRPGARAERHAQEGRHPAGRHGGPEDGRPGDLFLDADVEPDPAHRRVSGDHRPRQRHPADARGELGGVRRPQDLDLPSAPGRDLAQRRGVRRRPRGLEHRALASTRTSAHPTAGCRPSPAWTSVEAVDKHTVRFNLNKPVLSVPEDCYNYPTAILHPSFKPPFSDNPIGTGPYTLGELAVGDRCILKRITQTTDGKEFKYWGGEVYLDEIHYYHFDADNQLTAFASGEVDTHLRVRHRAVRARRGARRRDRRRRGPRRPLCCRFQVTEEPFDNKKLRQAIVKAADNTVYRDLVFQGRGDVGENHHVAPVHPEYFQLPPLQARRRGRQGAARGGRLCRRPRAHASTSATPTAPGSRRCARSGATSCKDAGITLNINVMPAVQVLGDLGQDAVRRAPPGPIGRSAPWCCRSATAPACRGTRASYANPEFDDALDEAEATARRRGSARPRWRRSRRSCRTTR